MNSIENQTQSAVRMDIIEAPKAPVYRQPVVAVQPESEEVDTIVEQEVRDFAKKEESTENKIRRSFFDRYVDKIKDLLDNAE